MACDIYFCFTLSLHNCYSSSGSLFFAHLGRIISIMHYIYMHNRPNIFGLVWSKETSVMTTPKHLGTQIFRWSVQIQIYPQVSDEVHTETQIFKWSVQIQIYPPIFRWSAQMKCTLRHKFSVEVFRFRYTPHFQMKCTLRPIHKMTKWVHIFGWSVQTSCQIYPSPPVSDEVPRWSAHWDPDLKWGNEFIFSDEVSR